MLFPAGHTVCHGRHDFRAAAPVPFARVRRSPCAGCTPMLSRRFTTRGGAGHGPDPGLGLDLLPAGHAGGPRWRATSAWPRQTVFAGLLHGADRLGPAGAVCRAGPSTATAGRPVLMGTSLVFAIGLGRPGCRARSAGRCRPGSKPSTGGRGRLPVLGGLASAARPAAQRGVCPGRRIRSIRRRKRVNAGVSSPAEAGASGTQRAAVLLSIIFAVTWFHQHRKWRPTSRACLQAAGATLAVAVAMSALVGPAQVAGRLPGVRLPAQDPSLAVGQAGGACPSGRGWPRSC